MHPILTYAPAKINLFLHITGKRGDGYHNLQTVFRLIDLYDVLTFQVTDQPIGQGTSIVSLTNDPTITADNEQNLIVKAARRLLAYVTAQQRFSPEQIQALPIVDIQLEKNIPMGAGLGGGSSDCATTLMMLNQVWQLGLSNVELRDIGAGLGADVPIFIFGQDAFAEGIGEQLTPIALPKQRLLLLMPDAHISTAQLFAHPALRRDCPVLSQTFVHQHSDAFTNQLRTGFSNVFQPVVCDLSSEVKSAVTYLQQRATLTHTTPRMTGSGSCVFLPLPDNLDNLDDTLLTDWQAAAPCASQVVNTL